MEGAPGRDEGGPSTGLAAGVEANAEPAIQAPIGALTGAALEFRPGRLRTGSLAVRVYDRADVLALKRRRDPVRVASVDNLK